MPPLDCLDGAQCRLGRCKSRATTLLLDGVLSCAAHGFSAAFMLRAFLQLHDQFKDITGKYFQYSETSKEYGPKDCREIEIGSMFGKYWIDSWPTNMPLLGTSVSNWTDCKHVAFSYALEVPQLYVHRLCAWACGGIGSGISSDHYKTWAGWISMCG